MEIVYPKVSKETFEKTPKVLYQTWKTKTIPERFLHNQQRWMENIESSSGWKYVLLDDKDLRDLVNDNFPQYIKAYDSFTHNIERVDFARYVMMYLGGVYADLDTYPTRSIDVWVDKGKIVLGREPLEHAKELYNNRELVLCNAFMISPPGKKMWINLMDYIVKNYEKNYKPVYNTGPMAMTLFMESNPKVFDDTIITDPCVFFPMLGTGEMSERCSNPKETYVVHEWHNTWVVPWYKDQRWFNTRYWFWGIITIATILALREYNRKR